MKLSLKERNEELEKELAGKNRELEIEAALEKVRARTMAMQHSDELSEVVFILFQQFRELGEKPDQATIGVINEKEKVIEYWVTMYGKQMDRVFKFSINEPHVTKKIFNAWKENKNSLVIDLSGKKLYEFANYREKMGGAKYNPDEKRRIINVAFFSKGLLNVQSTEERSVESIRLLERFASVFDQTYTRFLDLQKAEAQAREAQIQLSLERVRAKTMAMHSSEDLLDVISVLSEQFQHLGFKVDVANFNTDYHEKDWHLWLWVMGQVYPKKIVIPYFDHPYFNNTKKSLDKGLDFNSSVFTKEEKNSFQKHFYNTIQSEVSEEHKKVIFSTKGFAWSVVYFKNTSVTIGNYDAEPYTEEQNSIFRRFGNVFEQTYSRFLDLQKAEAQAREAKIEVALERVRSRSMGMQKSDELKEVIQIVFKQFVHLGIQVEHTGFVIDYKARDDYNIWIADPLGVPSQVIVPYFDSVYYNRFNEAKKNGEDFFATNLSFEEKNKFYQKLFEYVPGLPEEAKKFYFDCPGLAASTVLLDNVCLYIENFSGTPYSDEENSILMRFGKVFQQTYTRFLDLQKAEEQAKEAQVEVALERVRSRTIAMQHSAELNPTADLLFEQLKQLGAELQGVAFAICDRNSLIVQKWTSIGVFSFPYTIDPAEQNMYEAWKNQVPLYEEVFEGERLQKYFETLMEVPAFREGVQKLIDAGHPIPTWQKNHAVPFQQGYLLIITTKPFNETGIFVRFGKVFEQTYTRFLDLQKAEAQAREAQIEAALERVRSRTAAMQKSEEMKSVIQTIYEQMVHLGIEMASAGFMIDYKNSDDVDTLTFAQGRQEAIRIHLPYFDHPIFKQFIEAKEKGLEFYTVKLNKEEKDVLSHHLYANNAGYTEERKKTVFSLPGYTDSHVMMKNVALYIQNFTGIPFPDADNAILMRFGKAFEQTYTRFIDLQKAEAQAREANIEAGLERVRSRAMAMQSSEELAALIGTVFTELTKLDLALTRCVIWIFNAETKGAKWWMANSEDAQNPISCDLPYNAYEPYLVFLEQWEKRVNKFQYELSGTIKKDWDDYLFNKTGLSRLPAVVIEGMKAPERVFLIASFNNFGAMNAATLEALSDQHVDILLRFAKVFDLTYTRFNDLKQAEAQTREAQIEAALERVRGKAMAMHSSQDLAETIEVFYHEMELLSITPRRCGVGLLNRESRIAELSTMNTTEEGSSIEIIGKLNLVGHPVLEGVYDNWLLNKEYHPVLRGNEIKEYYQLMRPQISYPDYPHDVAQFGYFFYFPEGGVYAWTNKELGEDELKIYRRFTTVLSLTYKRYKDLKDSELRAREAVKQASLDRVRGEISGMRTAEDLQRITPLIFKELTTLGIPFFRCGVFIINESENKVHVYLSAPDGHSLAVLNLLFDSNELTANSVKYWRNNRVYHQHWNKEEFINWTHTMMKLGQIQNPEAYQGAAAPPDTLDLHFVPFRQGMLYVGNSTQLSEDEIALVKSLAEAFSIAYSRYEDFTTLEKAKESIENTLTELKAAQKQLIQSEKMASLGELTAGIAHEIQNPLNFVNNFSEVNTELIDELQEKAQKGNMDEVKAIANDIKENEQKINHHGQRAAAIVKGMLQHSRSSTGVKEPTDINALCDEYLRLSYHGLRAKDKSFNATMKTDFDSSIGKINVIPQDMGRVLLNLFNNAFYAVNARLNEPFGQEQISQKPDSYKPTVSVSTKKSENHVIITVSDNGNGIPQKIVDKIFQPFFTTKPTGQGTGLGLSLSYDIVKAHGGEIKVETPSAGRAGMEKEGTTFIIQLPAA